MSNFFRILKTLIVAGISAFILVIGELMIAVALPKTFMSCESLIPTGNFNNSASCNPNLSGEVYVNIMRISFLVVFVIASFLVWNILSRIKK